MRDRVCLSLLALAACGAPQGPPGEVLTVESPASFGRAGDGPALDASPWWRTFESNSLDEAVSATIAGSLELQQAWARLAQAEAARPAGARDPLVDISGSVTRLEIDQRGGGGRAACPRGRSTSAPSSATRSTCSVASTPPRTPRASRPRRPGRRPRDALALSGRAADAWFVAVENAALERLVLDQLGRASSSSRSRARGSRTAAARPTTCSSSSDRSRPRAPNSRCWVAPASAPTSSRCSRGAPQEARSRRPTSFRAPSLPALDVPGASSRRPDLDAAFQRLALADRDLAAAVAARFPRLALSASYNFDAAALADLFDRTISVLTASLVAPVSTAASAAPRSSARAP